MVAAPYWLLSRGETSERSCTGADVIEDEPFDRSYRSPILSILALRNDGVDSVVPLGGLTERQARVYRPDQLDVALGALAAQTPPLHAIFATGSAGSGKSAAVEQQASTRHELYSDVIEDATHSDSPRHDQAVTLRDRFSALADDAQRPDRPILIAANIGMLLQLFDAWAEKEPYSKLERAVLAPLGLREPEPLDNPGDLRVAVLNLDDRPTAGQGGLLSEMLPLLAPDNQDGVFNGAGRCGSCCVRDWCPVRSNAILASGASSRSISDLALIAARERGRHDSPRILWDWLSRILAPPMAFDGTADPCDAVVAAAQVQDDTWRLQNLLPVSVFAADGELGRRIGALDPALGTSKEAYIIMASAGLDPENDAGRIEILANQEPMAEALVSAVQDVRNPTKIASERPASWRYLLARMAIGAGVMTSADEWQMDRDGVGKKFDRALSAYKEWQLSRNAETDGAGSDHLNPEAAEVLESVVDDVGQGLARLFGVLAEGQAFLPLRSYDGRSRSRVHVAVEFDSANVQLVPDLTTKCNPSSAKAIGHDPLEIRIKLRETEVALDLPTYRLLMASLGGLAAPSQSDERFHALRRAAESLARGAAEEADARLLVEGEQAGSSYLITQTSSLTGAMSLRSRSVKL